MSAGPNWRASPLTKTRLLKASKSTPPALLSKLPMAPTSNVLGDGSHAPEPLLKQNSSRRLEWAPDIVSPFIVRSAVIMQPVGVNVMSETGWWKAPNPTPENTSNCCEPAMNSPTPLIATDQMGAGPLLQVL